MTSAGSPPQHPRERWWLYLLVLLGMLAVIGLVITMAVAAIVGVEVERSRTRSEREQAKLEPFYTPPAATPEGSGTLIRSQEIEGAAPKGSRVWRILYTSERADGTRTVSSGSVFVPDGPAPAGGRPVLAWAHGTLGMGDACAPSRSDPQSDMTTWLPLAMANGWAVVATDYAGLGTPGVLRYLIGADEARDVINSVRAIRGFTPAAASNRMMVFGHSQGGHASLFTAAEVAGYAPELELVAAAAAAPAAELTALIDEQWNQTVSWVIGPEVVVAWPTVYPDLDPHALLTRPARRSYRGVAQHCIKAGASEGLIRQEVLGQRFFARNPVAISRWRQALEEQTPAPLDGSIPVLVAQGLDDSVVLPNTTALLVERWCVAGSDLSSMWMGDVTHMKAALVSGPTVVDWLAQRLAGKPPTSTCGLPLPVAAARG